MVFSTSAPCQSRLNGVWRGWWFYFFRVVWLLEGWDFGVLFCKHTSALTTPFGRCQWHPADGGFYGFLGRIR